MAYQKLPIEKIISGGQTGADRGGLEAGLLVGIPIGGFCPKGRIAEDGVIPKRYVLEEMSTHDYRPRTEANVLAADLTVILVGSMTPGSALTVKLCVEHKKPHTIFYVKKRKLAAMAKDLAHVIAVCGGTITLNVAGSRESKCPGIQRRTTMLLLLVYELLSGTDCTELLRHTETPVINRYHLRGRFPLDGVDISRQGKWGNRFRIADGLSREECLEQYRALQLRTPGRLKEIRDELIGSQLVCTCKPKPCHGDVLYELAYRDEPPRTELGGWPRS